MTSNLPKSDCQAVDVKSHGLSTVSVHAGEARQKPGDAIVDPIFCTSTYTFPSTQSIIDFIEHEHPREEYGRYGSPGERVVERKLAALAWKRWKPYLLRNANIESVLNLDGKPLPRQGLLHFGT